MEVLKKLQDRGVVAIPTRELTRAHRERLVQNGFVQEVMKGWYYPTRPDEPAGESTSWYASFWGFSAAYLKDRFGPDWCLSPEHSLSLHAGNHAVPRQLVVRAPGGGNKPTDLLFGTSLFDMRSALPNEDDVIHQEGLRLFSQTAALVAVSPGFFKNSPTDARAVLATVGDASGLLHRLLEGGHSTIAGRLAGAFRNIGRDRLADEVIEAMRAAGYTVREQDPFETRIDIALPRPGISPYAGRLRLMWAEMRPLVIERFPAPPGLPAEGAAYLRGVQDAYVTDAYHSLSIEGYRVGPGLIERVRGGHWNPEANRQDREHRDALAARGYWQAFQAVQRSLDLVLRGGNPGEVAEADQPTWYQQMFAPGVVAGILQPADLAGYRNGPVFIRRSMHLPPSREAVRDAMPVFFELLMHEAHPAVRAVLGHFFFVYIHPYPDGNGRMGRFLMNLLMAAGGYPWTVVPFERRDAYMGALEDASVRQDITAFADFLAQLVEEGMAGRTATLPIR